MGINRENGVPKYVRLKAVLVKEIRGGNYKAGDKFFTEKELMSKYGLSYATVTHAIRGMTEEGYFIRKKSLGTFITEFGIRESAESKVETAPLYINDVSHLCDRTKTPLSWVTYDQIQKGVINSYNGPIKIVPLQELLGKRNINAVIINPENVPEVQDPRCRYIIINLRSDIALPVNSVAKDVLMGVHDLMAYLVADLGHRRIGFIGGNTIQYHAAIYAGYEIALRTYGIPFKAEYAVRGLVGTEEDGDKAMRQLLSLPVPPTAVFCDTDLKAFGAVKAAKDADLNVPLDISIAGYGDIPESDNFDPPLTTLHAPHYTLGQKAVELLLERIRTNDDVKTEILHNVLHIRSSCAEAKKHHT